MYRFSIVSSVKNRLMILMRKKKKFSWIYQRELAYPALICLSCQMVIATTKNREK